MEVKNQLSGDCVTEVRLKDKIDGSYKVRYFLKDTGKCPVSVKINEEHIRDSHFLLNRNPDSSDTCYLLDGEVRLVEC